MSDSNVALVRDAYEAFGRQDLPAVMAAFAEDIEWNVPEVLPHGAHVRGHEAVQGFFQKLAETWQDFGLEIGGIDDADGRVYARGSAHGRTGGTQTGYGFVHVWTVRDGKLARLDEYIDPAPDAVARG